MNKNISQQQSVMMEMNKETDMISSLIHEYLYKKDYNKTLDVFQIELTDKIKNNIYYKPQFKDINDTNLLNSFDKGLKNDFFLQWNRMIPNHMKLIEPQINKLDFFLEIYFAIYPILYEKKMTNQISRELKTNMEEFKKYLDSKQIELSKTTEFLAYYALPYVPNPKEHPSYKQLFTLEWVNGLKDKIKECIKNYLPSPSTKFPVLYELISNGEDNNNMQKIENLKDKNNNNETNSNAKLLEMENGRLNEEIKKIKNKEEKSKIAFIESQKTWTNLTLGIINNYFNLVDIYKQKLNETTPQIEKMNKKLLKYQSFLKRNAEELEKNKNNSNNSNLILHKEDIEGIGNSKYEDSLIQNQSNMNEIQNNNNNNNMFNQENILNQENIQEGKSIQIDYVLSNLLDMKRFVLAINHKIMVDDNKLFFIFREIRLRAFRRNDTNLRNLTLYSIFFYDLFGTLSKNSTILHELLQNQILNLEVMKILNLIASLIKGRNYLLQKDTLIDDIVQIMIREKSDTELRQNCLGTIQKFTLRAEPQNKLIELNIIHYIVDLFSYESNNLSDYTTEYGLALIMNLSLRKAGREKFENVAEKTLQILLNFFDKNSLQVSTCINGTLYSLLKREVFKNEAKKIGLDKKLLSTNVDNPQLKKQISYILEELNKPQEEDDEYDENFGEDITAKDEDEINYDEYADAESIDENLLEEHYKILGDFIIRNNELNSIEEQKITNFMKTHPNMIGVKSDNKSLITNSISSTIKPEDVNRPLRRPTTPNTNMSMTGTSQAFNEKKSYIKSSINNNKIQIKNNNEDLYSQMMNNIPIDSAKAFEKKDLITRSPPRKFNNY